MSKYVHRGSFHGHSENHKYVRVAVKAARGVKEESDQRGIKTVIF